MFDLGVDPRTDFRKLAYFIYLVLNDEEFNGMGAEMMEEYSRNKPFGMSRQTISKYLNLLEDHNLISLMRSDCVYYRVYKKLGVQTHEILTLEVSRLARSTKQLCDIIETVKAKHLRLSIVGSIQVDCSNGELDPMTNAFIQMSGVFAELELRIIRERVKSGMRNAAAKGAKIGRPQTTKDDIPPSFYRHYASYKNGTLNISELSRVCNISRTTAYKYLSLLE